MVSTVRSRPSHYETLGVTPAASDAEILQAFAREMSMFRARPMAAVAQISVAYETLRNPDKRRAYDASLEVKAGPQPLSPPARPTGQDQPRSSSSPPAGVVAGPAVQALKRPPRPLAKPQAANETLPEGRLGSFIAESLRKPPRSREAPLNPEPKLRAPAVPGVEAHLADLLAARHSAEDASGHSAAWKRPAVAAGALVLTAALAGALLGWRGGTFGTAQQAEPDMAIALPAPTPARDVGAPSTPHPAAPAPAAIVPETRPEQLAADTPTQRTPPTPRVAEEPQAPADRLAEGQSTEQAAGQAVAETPAATSAAALPLSNAVIARTIGRVGYACGQVASTEAVEGEAAGVFKVTCTSGQSYRAAPVRGRYHFRRWGRQ